MTLTQLRYLAAIVDSALNITAAAERVYATQPGVSRQIRRLEEELGFQIFTRRGKSLAAVTPAGAQVIERARVILAESVNISALAANLRNVSHGELSIATTHTQARFVLPGILAAFNRSHPDVSVHLMPGGDAEVLGLLERGDVDFAIQSTVYAPPDRFRAIPLYRWERIGVVLKAHALADLNAPATLADLSQHPLVSYESVQRPDSSLRRAFDEAGLTPRIACTARDADLIKTYVRAGLGVGVLGEMALLPEDHADLTVLEIDGLLPTCTTWLLIREDKLLRRYERDFILALAPRVDRHDLRRAFEVGEAVDWPEPPHWREVRQDGPQMNANQRK